MGQQMGKVQIESPMHHVPSMDSLCSSMSSSSTREESFPGVHMEDFELVHELAEGATSHVYLVRHKTDEALYAMKEVNGQTFHLETQNEIDVLWCVDHPTIVRLLASVETTDKIVHLIMEYVTGNDVQTLLRAQGQLPTSIVRFVAGQVALALQHLHTHGILYRDLKPENVMLDEDGYVRLVDFGSARFLGQPMGVTGTPEYLAPEVIRQGGKGWSSAADWWAFGIFVYELLVGHTPFHVSGGDAFDVYRQVLAGTFEWPQQIDATTRDLVEKLLVTDPRERLGANPRFTVLDHSFFHCADWEHLCACKEIPSPVLSLGDRGHTQ